MKTVPRTDIETAAIVNIAIKMVARSRRFTPAAAVMLASHGVPIRVARRVLLTDNRRFVA